jgi:hypothetical protein
MFLQVKRANARSRDGVAMEFSSTPTRTDGTAGGDLGGGRAPEGLRALEAS